MKYIINREQILGPLQQIVSVIEKRQTMPILSNVLMNVSDNLLVLTGTDLEIQIVSKLAIEPEVCGETTLPARKLLDICRLLPANTDIKFEQQDDKVKIQADRSRFSLSTLPAENYPDFSETEFEYQFKINAAVLKKALDKTIFAMANQDVRYYLNGLMLNISNSQLRLVGSDGHRLSVYDDKLDEAYGFESRIILPRKGVIELHRLLGDLDTELQVEFSNNNIRVYINDLTFSAKLVDSKYPDFNKVFKQAFLNPIHIQKQLLKDALTRVAILSNEKIKGLTCEISENKIKLTAYNPEQEQAEEELVIEYQGEPVRISFNVQYLLDAVSNLDSELAVLLIASNKSSCIVEEPDEQRYKFIVMPIHL